MIKKSICCLCCMLLLAACRKEPYVTLVTDNPPVAPQPPRPMIKTVSYTDNSGNTNTEHYYYDSLWRLVKYEYTIGSNFYTDTFTYRPGYVSKNGSTYLQLGADSLCETEYWGSWYSDRHYSYNSNLNNVNYYSMVGSCTSVYDSIYNMVERHTHVEANPPNYIYYDYYYTYNNHLNTIGNYNKGQYYLGKSSVNLIERQDWDWYLNQNDSTSWSVILYNYTYNHYGWVSSMENNQFDISVTQIDSVTFVNDTTRSYSKFDYTYY